MAFNSRSLNGIRLLIIDKSDRIIFYLKEMLMNEENIDSIYSATSVKDAKAIMETQMPDAVIIDLFLELKKGVELLEWIKLLSKNTFIIVFTNLSDKLHRETAKNLGADYFLDKSFEFEKLPVIISELSYTRIAHDIL